jgi:hypothetical protein
LDKKLFAFYLGGRADGCNIELHDVVFVVAFSLEETPPLLTKKWFGNKDRFHIDSYICLEHVDGHEIHVTKDISEIDPSKNLYFINLGAYKPAEFTEYHQSAFYVSQSPPEAIRRAKSELCQGLETIHKDDVVLLDRVDNSLDFDVDDIMEIREIDEYYVSLKPSMSASSVPIAEYIKLDMLTAAH